MGAVPLDLSETLSTPSWTSSCSRRRDASSPLQEDRLSHGARERPRVPQLAPLEKTPETVASGSANRTPLVADAQSDLSTVSAMKQYWEHRSSCPLDRDRDREFRSPRSMASTLQRHSRQHFERQRPLTEALSEMVAGFCDDSLLDGSLADTSASMLLSEDGILDSATRGLDSDGSGDEDIAGQDLLLLQRALERDAELWWKMQRRLIRLIMRVAKKRQRCGQRCACGQDCAACGPGEAVKLAAQSASPRFQVQEEPAGEPDAGSL